MSDIKSTREADVATITIDRGSEGGKVTVDQLRDLTSAFRAAGASDAKLIALRSTGNDFCRGRDPRRDQPSFHALAMRENVVKPILDVYDAISSAPQPIVCAVQGGAFGFGCARSQPPAT